jgi:two-component system, OmpR family, copper resistance phosphate regulon response regulator CusR
MRILVVEDDKKVAAFVRKGLTEEQYVVDLCHDGAEGVAFALNGEYDAIILDLLLPKLDGMAVCKQLRAQGVLTPIIMLTAKDATDDKVRGLDVGADDYLTKPFSFAELLARLRALFRRSQLRAEPHLRLADLELDPASRVVTRAGRRISLTGKEYALLEFLLRNKGRVLTETRILEHVWELDHDPGTNIVSVYVYHLRGKIDKGHERRLLHTVRGAGFVLSDEQP